MWHQEHKNGLFPGQVMGPPFGSQSTMANIKVSAPPNAPDMDFASESSRKRKSMSMVQPGNDLSNNMPRFVPQNFWPNESYQQHKRGGFSGTNVEGNIQRMSSHQIPLSSESSINKVPQLGNHQFQSPSLLNLQTSEGTFYNSAYEKLNQFIPRTQAHSFHQKEPLALMHSQGGTMPTFPGLQFPAYNVFSQNDVSVLPPCRDPGNTSMEMAQTGHGLKDGVNVGGMNYSSSANSVLELPSKPSESSSSLEVSHLENGVFDNYVELDGRTCGQDICKTEIPFEVKQSDQSIDVQETVGTSTVRTGSLEQSACSGRNEIAQSSEVRVSTLDNGATAKGGDEKFESCDTQLIEEKKLLDMVDRNHSLTEEVCSKNNSGDASCILNGTSKPEAGKVAPTTVEKLWDGPLQLNSTTTVSAVAFFKSGEKAPDINWSTSVEVKGKVRLEAFEKFIQELPRSRSRGLMVTSLCWNAGSSETGLKGMKEVSKGYKHGKKVGVAPLSPGIDLYVCPRSDAIITILAKYGFFKGMAAVEGDQDSLIGCVVWKRKLKSSDISKKEEMKSEQPRNSSNFVIQENAEATPRMEKGGDSSPHGTVKESTPPERTIHKGIDSRSISSSEILHEAGNSSNENNQKQTLVVVESSPVISDGLKPTFLSDSTSRDGHVKTQIEIPSTGNSDLVKPTLISELPRPFLPLPPPTENMHSRPAAADDDLPEFDFSTACGVPQRLVRNSTFSVNNAHPPGAASLEKKLLAEGTNNNNANRRMSSSMPVVHLKPMANGQRLQFPSFPVASSTTTLPILPAKRLENGESTWPQQSFPMPMGTAHGNEVSNQVGSGKPVNNTVLGPQKNLWDDDMPEWCPPDMKHQNPTPPMTNTGTSILCMPSLVPNPKSEMIPPGPPPRLPGPPPRPPGPPPRPPGPPPRPPGPPPTVPINPPLPKGLPPGYQHRPTSTVANPAEARPVGGSAHIGPWLLKGLPSNSMSGSQANMFDVRPPSRPPWRGWRP